MKKTSAEIADRLHAAAIHLLRRLRREDNASGLTAPRLSALSVIVFGGPISVSDLAAAEQVRKPTISRLISGLVQDGLVRRLADKKDERVTNIIATAKGRKLLTEGKARRVARLASDLEKLTVAERNTLADATEILGHITLPEGHPDQTKRGS